MFSNSEFTTKNTTSFNIAKITTKEALLDMRLEELGVHKIDPNNKADMQHLAEVMLGLSNAPTSQENQPYAISAPPNLSMLASCYSLYQYSGTYTVNGQSYNYSYIRVTDNKGYSASPLTKSQQNTRLIGRTSTVLSDLLNYQFSFGFSSFLGKIPSGWALNWTIGSAFSVLNSLSSSSSVVSQTSNSKDIYYMGLLSVTEMTYYYVYMPSSNWQLCGARASNISMSRTEALNANINGKAYGETKTYPKIVSSTGSSASTYVTNYVTNGYCKYDTIGYIKINGMGGISTKFTPGFSSSPTGLI